MSRGRLFQSLGALLAKALSPLVTLLVLGTSSRARLADLNWRAGTCGFSNSFRYPGARPFWALKVKVKILKSILRCTGSQCSEANTGVMCSDFLVPVMSLAAAFCMSCKRCMDPLLSVE